jgi:hypothetical protein
MRKAVAVLKKLATDDMLFEMWGNIPLNKTYEVDLDTIQIAEGFNTDHKVFWKKEIIFTIKGIEWFPTELFDIYEKEKVQ